MGHRLVKTRWHKLKENCLEQISQTEMSHVIDFVIYCFITCPLASPKKCACPQTFPQKHEAQTIVFTDTKLHNFSCLHRTCRTCIRLPTQVESIIYDLGNFKVVTQKLPTGNPSHCFFLYFIKVINYPSFF